MNERGSQPVVSRYVGGFSSVALSAAFGTSPGTPATSAFQQDCVKHWDATTLYAASWDGLYRSTDSGATFVLVNAFTSPNANVDDRIAHGGVHFVYDSGADKVLVAGWFKNNSNALIGWTFDPSGPTYTEYTGPTKAATDDELGSEILYGHVIHFALGQNNAQELFSFDPTGSTVWTDYTEPHTNMTNAMDFAIGPDSALYLAALRSADFNLYRFAGSWSFTGTIDVNVNFIGTADQREALFSDGTDLYALKMHSNAGGSSAGWRVFRIPAPFDLTGQSNVTTTVLPGSLRSSDDGGTGNGDRTKRAFAVRDTSTNAGTVDTYLGFADGSAPGTPWSINQWNGPSSMISFVGSGGDVADAIPKPTNGGGRFYTPGQNSVRITKVDPTTGAETISFIGSGGGTGTVRFRRKDKGQSATAVASLVAPVTGGGSLGTDEVTGVTLDGATVNTVGWDFFSDGFNPGEALSVLDPEVT
jgi:hypothetical protein